MRLEGLPNLKQKVEELLENLLIDADVSKIDWTVKSDIQERKITVEIMPQFKDVADESKFGVTGEKGSDMLPEKPKYEKPEQDEEYPNLS